MSNPDSDQRPSAAGLLRDLKDTFAGLANTNWLNANAKEPARQASAPVLVEDPSLAKKENVVVSVPEQVPPVPVEGAAPDWLTPLVVEDQVDQIVLAESSAETMVRPPAAPTVVGQKLSEPLIVEDREMPAWLSAPAPRDSDLPTLVGAPPAPAVEVPTVPVALEPVEAKVEVDPLAGIKEFNGQMELIRKAQEFLGRGGELSSDEKKQALMAAARANSLLPKLPKEVLDTVILMRAVAANNPKFGREDFQREMLVVVDQVRGGGAKKA